MFHFFRTLLYSSASVFPNNLALYLKDLKLLSLTISAISIVVPSLCDTFSKWCTIIKCYLYYLMSYNISNITSY